MCALMPHSVKSMRGQGKKEAVADSVAATAVCRVRMDVRLGPGIHQSLLLPKMRSR